MAAMKSTPWNLVRGEGEDSSCLRKEETGRGALELKEKTGSLRGTENHQLVEQTTDNRKRKRATQSSPREKTNCRHLGVWGGVGCRSNADQRK